MTSDGIKRLALIENKLAPCLYSTACWGYSI